MNAVVFERLPTGPATARWCTPTGGSSSGARGASCGCGSSGSSWPARGCCWPGSRSSSARLEAEGLIDPARKRPLPLLPRRVGLVTSGRRRRPRRRPAQPVGPLPGGRRGAGRASRCRATRRRRLIARALRHLDRRPDVDVIVVARGGGSLEDLMAFNCEAVCRAVAASGDAGRLGRGARARRDGVRPGGRPARLDPDGRRRGRGARRRRRSSGASTRPRAALGRCLARAGDAGPRGPGRARPRPGAGAARPRRARPGPGASASGARSGARPGGPRRAAPADLAARARPRWRGRRAGAPAPGRRRGWSGAAALLSLLSPERTVARGYAIVRDAGGGAVSPRRRPPGPGQDARARAARRTPGRPRGGRA